MSEAGVEPTAAADVRDPTTGHTDGDDDDSTAARPTPNVDDSTNDDAPRAAHGTVAAMEIAEDSDAAISPSLSPLSPGSRKMFTVAEVPRWRFVNVAKKTSGYSSVAAGTVVEGISAEELAAKYEAPEIEEEPVKQKAEKKIGKLKLLEVQKEAEETITGTFAGFKKRSRDVRADGPTKDELETLEVETLEPPLVHPLGLSPLIHDLASQMEENTAQPTEKEPTELEMLMAEAFSDGSDLDRSEKQVEPAVSVEPAEPTAHASADEETVERKLPEQEEEPQSSKRKKHLLLLLLLLLVVLATVLGVLLGGKDSENDSAGNKAVNGATIKGEEINVNKTPSFVPTFSPTFSPISNSVLLEVASTPPTEYLPVCPANTNLLTLGQGGINNDNNGVQDEQLRENSMSTWVVKDACNGKEVMRCQPCLNYTPSALLDDARSSTTTVATTTTTTSSSTTLTTTTTSTYPLGEIREECVGRTLRPRPLRDGERFRFNLLAADARCADGRGLLYNWGQFAEVANFNDCAYKCVGDTPEELVRRGTFRGYDYNCDFQLCRCLYDEGTLESGLGAGGFYGTSLDQDGGDLDGAYGGSGEISGTAAGFAGYYCGKLVDREESDVPTHSPTNVWGALRLQVLIGEDAGVNEEHAASGSSDDVSGCLPDDNDYVFEVERSDGAGACCGFDPDSFIVTYNGIEVTRGEPYATNIFSDGDGSSADPSNGGKIYFGQRTELCPSSDPSTEPSVEPSWAGSAPSPLPLLRDVTDATIPCREVIESELAGRINGLSQEFCGFCQWNLSSFNCYQRIAWLKNKYGTGPLEARNGLLDQGHCRVPSEIMGDLLWNIEQTPYCGNAAYLPTMKVLVPSANPVTDIPTEGPSDRPTALPSERPMPSPTRAPSDPPSTSPIEQPTSKPTQRPSNPPTTARPSNRPTNVPMGSPSTRPTTAPPSKKPTKIPTQRPFSPTEKPSCDAEYEDFNLCFAIDMSGSVCNQKTGFECYDCEPNIICNEMGIDMSMCCSNFFEVVEFAKLMVETLESVPANQAYTVVRFANDATLASGIMIRPDEALEALKELTYSGGLTNHAAAFDKCRESGSLFRRKDLILLITDGDPSEPPGSAQADTVKAADKAKAEGISIIPVMIVPEVVTELNPQTVAYLKEISSDGSIFEVSDFSVLETLQGSLLAQVSCQV